MRGGEVLRRYLSRMFLARVGGCLLGLAAIGQLLDLLDKTGELLTRGGIGAIGRYILMRLPATLAEMFALATLIGALVTFTRLARSLEMTVLAAAGLSLRAVGLALLPACALIAALQFVFVTELAPRSERAVADWWARTAPPGTAQDDPHTLWLRVGRDVAAIDRVGLDGRHVDGIEILRRAPSGELASRIEAASGDWNGRLWVLHDVRVAIAGVAASESTDQALATMDWPQGPAPKNLVSLARPVESLSLDRLIAVTVGAWVGARGPRYQATQIEALLASVFDPLVMVLIALPLAMVPPRAEQAAWALLRVLALGLGYLAAVGLLDALGNAGTLPGPVAAWAGLLIFGGYGLTRLLAADLG
jgi:lipopolysaccharide export system permease protein